MKSNSRGQSIQLRHWLTKYWVLVITIAVSLAAYGGMVGTQLWYGTLRAGYTPYAVGWYGLAFAAYLGALWWIEQQRGLPFKIIWGAATVFRVLLLLTTPTLSDDVYRYMWDGYLVNQGVSPYAYPVNSPALDYLASPQRALTNNAWMASPYLPAAQYLFAGLTRLSATQPLIFQAAMVIIDLFNGLLLVKLLAMANLPTYRVFIYLWNPLVIVEVAHGAHIDAWMILLTLLALWFTFSPRPPPLSGVLGSIALALGTLTKGLPGLLLPILFWHWRWWQLLLYGAVLIGLLIPAGLAAGWGLTGPLDGTGLFGAIRIYTEQWNFNSGLFHWLEVTLANGGVTEANRLAKTIMAIIMALAMGAIWLTARSSQTTRSILRLMAYPFMAYILLTTTVHPWYLLILLAFLPFLAPHPAESPRQWLALPPWLYLSGALALSYLTYLDPLDFRELAWVRNVEWGPTLGLVIIWAVASLKLKP